MSTKITDEHTSRSAIVYVRQSTPGQVVSNRESQRRQYALRERASELGFQQVEVIDDDLGRSGSGLARRPGFERLVGKVCSGETGAVFCIEASRLARNGRDWHHLIDFCGLVGTVIVDPDGVYDPRLPNDRLLLGLKGTMSEFELTLFRQRSFEAKRDKAKRGELHFRLPVGLRWAENGLIEQDPDRRVQQAIRGVFGRFEQLGTVRQVLLSMRDEKLHLPAIVQGERPDRIEWKPPVYNTVLKFLKNPLYAGAYAYGKTEGRTAVVDQQAHRTFGHRKAQTTWTVLIPDHHPGYISWEQFERNQATIASNVHMKQTISAKAGRGGKALLASLIRCRRCGRMLHVVYGGSRQPGARYECRGANINHGTGPLRCLAFGALRADEAIGRALVEAVSPRAIEAAVERAEQMTTAKSAVYRAASLELEQAQYEVGLARRRYESVDPANRLVAAELEARWNVALAHAKEIEDRLNQLEQAHGTDQCIDRDLLMTLADSLAMVWSSSTDMRLKQRIVRMLVSEVVADVDEKQSEIVLVLHWHGGRHSELRVPKNRTGQHYRTASHEVDEIIRRMHRRWPREEIAATLNRMKLRTGTGLSWNALRVAGVMKRLGLATDVPRSDEAPTLTLEEAVDLLGISNTAILGLIKSGLIPARQVVRCAPYEIDRAALDAPEVKEAVRKTKERGRHARRWAADRRTLPLPGLDESAPKKPR